MSPPTSLRPEAGRPDEYDAARGGEERGVRFARMFEPHFAHPAAAGGVTLDIGVGTAIVAKALADLGRTVVGIDRSHEMLQKAQTRLPGRVALGDAMRLPIREASVEDAYSVWLLHLVDIRSVLAEVARVLRPGGRYLVTPTSDGRSSGHPVRQLTERMVRTIRGGSSRPDAPDFVIAAAEGLPLRPVTIFEGDLQSYNTTARASADLIERRVWFAVRDVGAEDWATVVAPTIEALRALPGQDDVVTWELRPQVLVLERTG